MTELDPGLRDELITRALQQALDGVGHELVQRATLEGADAPDRLARHLAAVARRLLADTSAADGPADAQARAVNAVVEALDGGDFDLLAVPPELLTGIRRPAEGLGVPYLPPAPVIPLSANELLVNGHGQPAIGQQLRSELPSATDVDLLVSFVIWTGVRTLVDELEEVVQRGGAVRVITTTYMGVTEPKALDALARPRRADTRCIRRRALQAACQGMGAASPGRLDDGVSGIVERVLHRPPSGAGVERATQRGRGRAARRPHARNVRLLLGRRGIRDVRARNGQRPSAAGARQVSGGRGDATLVAAMCRST